MNNILRIAAVAVVLLFASRSARGNELQIAEAQSDAFGRLRSSGARTLFEATSEYGLQTNVWETITNGALATVLHDPTASSVVLTVATNDGSGALRQSYAWPAYEPGKSQMALITFAMGAPQAGITRRVGLFNSRDGIFIEQDATNYWLCIRSSVGGTTNTTRVPRGSWNLDNAASVDLAKAHILVLDYQWLGVGRVRYGFDIDGKITMVHAVSHAGAVTNVYMSSGSLPVRYEIQNTGGTTVPATLRQICAAVFSEGGEPSARGATFGAGYYSGRSCGTTFLPVCSIAPAFVNSGRTNRATIRLVSFDVGLDSGIGAWEIRQNATLTSANFAAVAGSTATQFDSEANVISGGIVIASGLVLGGTGAGRSSIVASGPPSRFVLAVNEPGTARTTYTLAVRALNGTVTAYGTLNWAETP